MSQLYITSKRKKASKYLYYVLLINQNFVFLQKIHPCIARCRISRLTSRESASRTEARGLRTPVSSRSRLMAWVIMISVRLEVYCHGSVFRSHRPRADRRRPRGWSVSQGSGTGGPRPVPASGKDAGTGQQPRSESG